MWHKASFKKSGTSYNQKKVSRDNNLQSICYQLQFSIDTAHYSKGLISIFEEIFDIINKVFILIGTMSTMLSFYEL